MKLIPNGGAGARSELVPPYGFSTGCWARPITQRVAAGCSVSRFRVLKPCACGISATEVCTRLEPEICGSIDGNGRHRQTIPKYFSRWTCFETRPHICNSGNAFQRPHKLIKQGRCDKIDRPRATLGFRRINGLHARITGTSRTVPPNAPGYHAGDSPTVRPAVSTSSHLVEVKTGAFPLNSQEFRRIPKQEPEFLRTPLRVGAQCGPDSVRLYIPFRPRRVRSTPPAADRRMT